MSPAVANQMNTNDRHSGAMERRLHRLERSAKEIRWSGVILVLCGVVGLVLYHLMIQQQLRTRRLLLDDDRGRLRAALAADDDHTTFFLVGPDGSPELELSTTPAGVAVTFSHKHKPVGQIFSGVSGTQVRFFGNDVEDIRFSLAIEPNELRMEVSDSTSRSQTLLRCVTDRSRTDAGCHSDLFNMREESSGKASGKGLLPASKQGLMAAE